MTIELSLNEYFLNKSWKLWPQWLPLAIILRYTTYNQTQLSCSSVQYSSTNDFETEMTVESGHSILKSTTGLQAYNFFTTISRFFWPWLIKCFHESLIYDFFSSQTFSSCFSRICKVSFFVKINSYIGIIFLFDLNQKLLPCKKKHRKKIIDLQIQDS